MSGIYDTARVKPPTHLIVHHAVSPEMRGWSDQKVRDWFNDIGKGRTYAGEKHSYHYEIATGKETFSAVPIVLVPNGDSDSINGDTWRIVEIFDWYNEVGWHCGVWDMNLRSVGCETAGRYDDKPLPNNAVWALANWSRNNIDKRNGGRTIIMGHKQLKPTACPGDWMTHIGLLIDMINNPDKYSKPKEDPKVMDDLLNQIKKLQDTILDKDKALESRQEMIVTLTDQRDKAQDELKKAREDFSNEFFKYKDTKEQELNAALALKKALDEKIKGLTDDEGNPISDIDALKNELDQTRKERDALAEQIKVDKKVLGDHAPSKTEINHFIDTVKTLAENPEQITASHFPSPLMFIWKRLSKGAEGNLIEAELPKWLNWLNKVNPKKENVISFFQKLATIATTLGLGATVFGVLDGALQLSRNIPEEWTLESFLGFAVITCFTVVKVLQSRAARNETTIKAIQAFNPKVDVYKGKEVDPESPTVTKVESTSAT